MCLNLEIFYSGDTKRSTETTFPIMTNRKYVTGVLIRHAGYFSSLFPAGTPSCKRVFLCICTKRNPFKSACIYFHLSFLYKAPLNNLLI